MDKRIWLITGVSSGLGRALAEAVIKHGEYVIGTVRRREDQEHFEHTHGPLGETVLLDLTDEQSVDQTMDSIMNRYGRIDVLVNNAGTGFVGAVEETSICELRSVFEINVMGTFKMTQAVLPHMRSRGQGRIIQISSHGGIKAFAGFGAYNASKFALEGFSEALAQEVKPIGLQVSIVEPGPFRTNFAGGALREAAMIIDDYADTAGAFRARLKSAHGKQEGDPSKAAQAIIELSHAEDAPLRLVLGKLALVTIDAKLESLRSDLERSRSTAEQAVFTDEG